MGNGSGVFRGDRNRNARLARLRGLVPVSNAIVGVDLADRKQMVVVCDHDSKVLARKTFRCRAWDLGAALNWATARAAGHGFAGVTVACEPTGHTPSRSQPSCSGSQSRRVALTARIGTRLATPRVGLLSGLVFALLPATSRYGQEARPYAIVVFAAVLSTLVLVHVLERPRRRTLAAYALAVALLGLLHVIALLLIPAHALVVLAVRRSAIWRWLVAAAIGMVPAVPVLYLGSQQTAQVSWIETPTSSSLTAFPATLLGTAVGAGMVLALAMFAVSTRYPTVLYASWAVTPLVCLFAVSQVTALWLPRYLLFTAPAWALLAGTALGRARLVRGVAGLVVVAAVGVTAQLTVREADGHLQATREAAALISARMKPGDAIVYSTRDSGAGVYGTSDRVGRDLVAHYIPVDRRPADVLQAVPQRTAGRVTAVECTNVASCLRGRKRIWVQRLGHQTDPVQNLGGAKGSVLRSQYYVSAVWYPRGLTVALILPKPKG